MSKSVSKISELLPSQIGCLTKLLNFDPNPPSTGGKDPGPRRVILTWLDMQYDWLRCGAFPEALTRPQGFHPSTIVPRIALHLPNSWVAPKAVICEAHKPLNPFLVRRIFVQIVGECSMRLARLNDLANELREGEKLYNKEKGMGKADETEDENNNDERVRMSKNVENWLNRMLSVNALWIPKSKFRVAYPTIAADMPKRIPLPHDYTKCEACILSYIGGNSQIICDIGVSLQGRLRRGQDLRDKLLWPLIDSWKSWIGETQEMKEQAVALGREIRQVRKRLQQRRREQRKSIAQTAQTANHDNFDPLRISARLLSPQFNDTDNREFLGSRFKEHLESFSGEENAADAKAPGRKYENHLKYIDDEVAKNRDEEVDARYKEYVDRLYADIAEMEDDGAEIGEGQTEQDERYYQESILGYYRSLPSKTSIVPASGDAYGTGEYVRPRGFSPSTYCPKTPHPNIKRHSYSEPSIGSGGWEDVEVITDESFEVSPSNLERTNTAHLQQEQEVDKPLSAPTPPPPKDIDNDPQRVSKVLPPPPTKMLSRKLFSSLRFRGRETTTSKYSNVSAAYKPYEPHPRIQETLPSHESLAEDPADLPILRSSRTSKSMSIARTSTMYFDEKRQSSLSLAPREVTTPDDESIEAQDIAEERANAYRTLVGESQPSRFHEDANPDVETITRTYYTTTPPTRLSVIISDGSVSPLLPSSEPTSLVSPSGSQVRRSSLIPPKPLAARSILSSYGSKFIDSEERVTCRDNDEVEANTVHTQADCTVPPRPTVEDVSDTESRVTHWSYIYRPKAAVAPAAPFSPMPSPAGYITHARTEDPYFDRTHSHMGFHSRTDGRF